MFDPVSFNGTGDRNVRQKRACQQGVPDHVRCDGRGLVPARVVDPVTAQRVVGIITGMGM
jgi:hypothetical protein